MDQAVQIQTHLKESVNQFHLPSYEELPSMGLYLEQVTDYIASCVSPLQNITITPSMISNYVKKGLIDNPIKKLYYPMHIAHLIFITTAKSVLSLEDISFLIRLQKASYDISSVYDYFRLEFENILFYVFGVHDSIKDPTGDFLKDKTLLRHTIIAIVHKIYLDHSITAIRALYPDTESTS